MIQVGSTVGNFQITAVLGEGAMATVFLGEHPRIGKRVAIKVIHPELSSSQEMVSRFFTEARAVSQLRHEHLVEIQDYGQTPEGDNFIIMEHLEGRTLAGLLEPAVRLPAARAVAITMQIAEALAAAHERGVVHRDLKPDNIFLLRRGGTEDFVKVLDFGLAKLTGGPAAMQRDHKTRTGSVLGTPHYMAPEQAEGKSTVDPRADVYSLGCILYRMLSGNLPFPGEGFGEVLVKHLREIPPPLRPLAPDVTPALEKIVRHSMAKRREYRFQSVGELWQALREPERFSAHIGEDLRQIMGPAPGEPESVPPRPPFVGSGGGPEPGFQGGSPAQSAYPAAAPPQAAMSHNAGGPVAAPEQKTMMAMMAPALPGGSYGGGAPPPGAPPGGASFNNMNTVLQTGGGSQQVYRPPEQRPLAAPGGGHAGTLMIDAPVIGAGGLAGPHGTGTLIADLSAPGMAARSAVQAPRAYGGGAAPVPGPPSRRGLIAGLVGGALLLGVGGAVLVPQLLKPKVYSVTISSIPDKAQVLKDGAPLGQTPLVLQVKAGEPIVRLMLRKEGFNDALRQVAAPAPPTLEVKLLAKQAPPPAEPAEDEDKPPAPAATEPPAGKGKGKGKPKAEPKIKVEPKAKAEPKAKVEPKVKVEPKIKAEPKAKPKKRNTGIIPLM